MDLRSVAHLFSYLITSSLLVVHNTCWFEVIIVHAIAYRESLDGRYRMTAVLGYETVSKPLLTNILKVS